MTLPRQTPRRAGSRQTGREIASTAAAFLAEGNAAGGLALACLDVRLVGVVGRIRRTGEL